MRKVMTMIYMDKDTVLLKIVKSTTLIDEINLFGRALV